MKKFALALVMLFPAVPSRAQSPDVKFIADTLVVQADGRYKADPDLATLSFSVFAQDKNLKQTYDQASQSMQKIAQIAEKNGLKKEDITFGVLTVRPYYEGDKKKRASPIPCKARLCCESGIFQSLARSSKTPLRTASPIFAH